MSRNLILSGGIFHPFETTSALVAEILAGAGIDSEVVPVDAGLRRLGAGERFDLLTFNCLSWSMTQHDKYAPYRDEYAREIGSAERAGITAHLAAGRGMLGLHTAAICFDDWPDWGDLLGARWVWGGSGHPPPGPLRVTPEPGHALTEGLGAFAVEDELYGGMELTGDVRVLARATADDSAADAPHDSAAQPVLTVRAPAGRVVYDALGHDERSFAVPERRQMLQRAGRWLLEPAMEARAHG